MLNESQLFKLEEELTLIFNNDLLHIISKLNREDRLNNFLDLIDLGHLIEDDEYKPLRNGKIIIAGESEISKETILSVAKNLNIDKNRIEMCLNYDEASKYNFSKTQYNPHYCLILVGAMGHSGPDKSDYSSVIVALEKKEGYPCVIRLNPKSLKITKSNLKEALSKSLEQGIITAD